MHECGCLVPLCRAPQWDVYFDLPDVLKDRGCYLRILGNKSEGRKRKKPQPDMFADLKLDILDSYADSGLCGSLLTLWLLDIHFLHFMRLPLHWQFSWPYSTSSCLHSSVTSPLFAGTSFPLLSTAYKPIGFLSLYPFLPHAAVSISTQSPRLTRGHKELALRLSKWNQICCRSHWGKISSKCK